MERIVQNDLTSMGVPPHLFFRLLMDATLLPFPQWAAKWGWDEHAQRVYLMSALETHLLTSRN